MKLLCFGDSNTYGYDPRGFFGGQYDRCWTDLLTRHSVINMGENGREIPRQPFAPPEHDMFLIMLGTNDLLQGASAAEAAARMEAFLIKMQPVCKQIVLLSPPPMQRGAWVPTDALVEESIRLTVEYRILAEKLGIPFIDTSHWNIELTFDGVHFTEKGHHIFAKNLQKQLDSLPT